MNREAVALGTPVLSTFAGRLGAVDEQLIDDGRLGLLRQPQDIDVWLHRPPEGHLPVERIRRDPQVLIDLLCSPLHG